ncbi:hypothetical protein [Sphingobium sp. D43FB]|uniref:hypothetical protein n=1 Tax=Sphingobium sp. D43FB TaxID=2017595 RepID=UPI000BB54E02|nr:hypothetical protein [Sphingobium sp. D43FB]PBN41385.1 hypothetical protein SxD43FB_22065 [Sphingobium sp. D43FB]
MGNHSAVKRAHIFILAVASIGAAAMAESYLGSTRYRLNDALYAVPHKYEFVRNFSVPWLVGVQGLDKEPNESVWLLLPASELSGGVQGYNRVFRGYSRDVEADMVVNVLGGMEAREFPADRNRDIIKVREELANGKLRQRDPTTGWDKVYWLVGEEETGSLFYLVPREGVESLPPNWRVPSCHGSPDINRHERFDCNFTIRNKGLTFDFTLRQENISTVSLIPAYVLRRLEGWRP